VTTAQQRSFNEKLGLLRELELFSGLSEADIEAIGHALETAPKTMGWRMRAKVGRRVRWYEVPEEVVR